MECDVVKLHQGTGAHEAYLQAQITEMYYLEPYADTRLMCVDGELAVNGVAAALCFPELLSCPSYHACQASLTLLLPDHTLHEIQHRLNTLITLKPAYIQVDVKLESDHSESEEEREEEEEDIAVPDSEPLEDSVSPVQKNTSKKTETRKRRAKIWRYFEDANTAGLVSCVECGEEVSAPKGGTNSMRRHLQKVHEGLYQQFLGKRSSEDTDHAPADNMQAEDSQPADSSLDNSFPADSCRDDSCPNDSWVWHFVGDGRQGRTGPTCRLCRKKIRLLHSDAVEGAVEHLKEHHWEEIQQVCLVCKGPAEVENVSDGALTCPDCGCRYHAGCIQEDAIDSIWCLYCRGRDESKPSKPSVEEKKPRGKQSGSSASTLCPHCGKEFRYLAQHMKLAHLGLIKYAPAQCDICKKVYTQKSHLKQHVKAVHEQVKDYKCNFCGRAFFRKMHFKRHMQTMHMNIHVYQHVTCGSCGKQFKSRTALYKHNRVVHLGIKSSRNLFCEECGQTFTQSGSLYSHMRKMHEKEPDIPKNRSNFFKDKVLVDTETILECHPELRPDIVRDEALDTQ